MEEADALLSAARLGIPVGGARLFCTTFPCHVCAKQIVAAGVTEVVYIEPYPKSRASSLFEDSISVERNGDQRVVFRQFVEIAPHRFAEFFSMRTAAGNPIRRKDDLGRPVTDERRIAAKELEDLSSSEEGGG